MKINRKEANEKRNVPDWLPVMALLRRVSAIVWVCVCVCVCARWIYRTASWRAGWARGSRGTTPSTSTGKCRAATGRNCQCPCPRHCRHLSPSSITDDSTVVVPKATSLPSSVFQTELELDFSSQSDVAKKEKERSRPELRVRPVFLHFRLERHFLDRVAGESTTCHYLCTPKSCYSMTRCL